MRNSQKINNLAATLATLYDNRPVRIGLRDKLVHYNGTKALADLKAGTNVALLAFPQAMAYAMIAGLPVQYGLYSAAIAPIVAALFASSRFTMVGPSNATAVMVLSVFLGMPEGRAHLRARAIIGSDHTDIRIFHPSSSVSTAQPI